MRGRTNADGSRAAVVLLVVVLVGASLQFAGLAGAATNVSISPSDADANATGVTYNATGDLQLGNQDTLQDVDVHLEPADVGAVGSGDVDLFINGVEYTDGFTEFSASDGTVEFKLSSSRNVNDGDTVRIEVADVTNPADDFTANATLHDTGDTQFEEFEDAVSIDTSASIGYEDLAFNDTHTDGNDTTVEVGENLTVSAVVNNTGEQSGTYNASLVVDGSVVRWENGTVAADSTTTVDFVTDFGDAGTYDVTIDDLAAREVTVVGSTTIVDGAAAPDPVEPGRTVDNQLVHVEVANVSQDGDTDTHYVEFPNELADGLSPNSADANATSITSSVNLVDGFDGDGVDDTLRFATSGDGGGAIDLNLTVDTGVSYPDREDAFEIDARTVDSSGATTTRQDVETIITGTAISNYDASNPDGRELAVSFDSTEQLADVTIDVTNASGTTVATFTESNLTETDEGDTWAYNGSQVLDADGSYDVTLEQAVDGDGNDVSDGETDAVRIGAQGVAIVDGTVDPASVDPGETVNNQVVTVTLANVSADGDTDTHYVAFPNELADGLSVNGASVNGSASIAQSAELVDGRDGDGVDDTVRFQTDVDGGGTVDLNTTVDVSVDYPDAETSYGIDATVEDSSGGDAGPREVATVDAGTGTTGSGDDTTDGTDDSGDGTTGDSGDDGTDGSGSDGTGDSGGGASGGDPLPPTVSGFDVEIDGQDVTVTAVVDARADALTVDLAGATVDRLRIEDFTREREDGTYVYSADVDAGDGATVVATLQRVTSATGSVEPDRVASATAGPRPSSFAGSPFVGADDSRHTLAVRIAENASVVGQPLDRVSVGYSDAFLATGGDLSSVSDDQNVERLLVVAANGSVRARLGGTDEVTVDTTAGTVDADLSTVDGERRPTIRAGDRIVVGLEPVTNPRTAGRYDTTVTLTSTAGLTHDLSTSVRIRDPAAVQAVDTGIVLPDAERTAAVSDAERTAAVSDAERTAASYGSTLTVEPLIVESQDGVVGSVQPIDAEAQLSDDGRAIAEFEETPTIESVVVESTDGAVGPVQAVVPSNRSAFIDDRSRPVVTTMILDRPVFAEDAEATLRVRLSLAELDGRAADHTIVRYDEDADEWRQLDTNVAERGNGTVTLDATTTSTSSFAVLGPAADRGGDTGSTPAPAGDAPDDSASSLLPAWLLWLLLLGIVLAALVAARRRE
ncbi:hypothetical protein [Halopenitus persicus]|uniref:PGF-pre-PGF domain-containing protein n=1 Tax=Halopenitus persicus TaxID=1048396 RepID=A0A1H3FJI2_9EURY|nr:hypothetical protein [Halopenitus persicus]SDX91212.1 hypothetical protein SAMN05216564_10289 [Halopenitus persicus]